MTQYARPDSDIENPGGWTIEPLWEKIDEEPYDDGDYLTSPKSASGKTFTIGLSNVTDPEIHTGHIVRIRASAKVTGTVKYELLQGAVVIKDSGDIVLATVFTEYNMTLSEGEAANISDYTDLRVRITAVATQKNQYQHVSWIRFDCPDAAANEFIYSGDVPVIILPDEPKASLSKSYAGDIPLVALPSCVSILERIYQGAVGLSILPDFPEAPLEKSYFGNLPLLIMPDFPKVSLEKLYVGDVGFVLVPTAGYSLEGLLEFIYSGNIPLSVLPGYSSALDMIYSGDIDLAVIPTSGYELKALIEVVKTVFLKSKLTERLVELKSTIKPSIVLNSEIKPEGEE